MKTKDTVFKTILFLSSLIVVFVTFGIFLYVFYKGADVLSFEFIFDTPKGIPLGTAGGIFPAIMGSFYLGIISGTAAGIIGILISVFLTFYGGNSLFKNIVQTSLYFISGFPSILFGLVGYSVLIHRFRLQRSLLTASIVVSVMILPFITIRLQKNMQERSLKVMAQIQTMGISKSHGVWFIILPYLFPQIISTIVLGMAYGIGAAAPVIYTGATMHSGVPESIFKPFMALSYHLYILANDGISYEYAYGTAVVLLALLIIINLLCKLFSNVNERRF